MELLESYTIEWDGDLIRLTFASSDGDDDWVYWLTPGSAVKIVDGLLEVLETGNVEGGIVD
jgi:hypothetical protein